MIIPADFPWRDGMRALRADGWKGFSPAPFIVIAVVDGYLCWDSDRAKTTPDTDDWGVEGPEYGWSSMKFHQPDPTDGATLGALLAAVRETMNPSQRGSANYYRAQDIGLLVTAYLIGETPPRVVFTALLAAWNARPR